MRLTLRTMLAYIDGILEPEDAEDIGKKIEESEFATDLQHRIRDVMRRLRLAAPGPADRQPGLDANTVAEYLDNTLHHGRVPDFEKVCLESEIHLAEVASCHQILALVLGEAAEIDPAARQRMYQLPTLKVLPAELVPPSDTAHPEISAGDQSPQREQPPPRPPRHKPAVPEYLREPGRKRRLPVTAAVVLILAACGTLVALGLWGQLARESRLMTWLLGPTGTEVASAPSSDAPASESAPVAPGPSEERPTDETDEMSTPSETSVEGDLPAVAPEPPEGDDTSAPEVPRAEPELPGVPPSDSTPTAEAPAEDAPPDGTLDPDTPPPGSEPPPPSPMGRLVSDNDVLLRFDSKSRSWQRVAPEGILVSDQTLLALPAYRAKLTLSTVMLQLLGGTQIELLPSNEQRPVGLKVSFGQVFISPLAEAGTRLRLVIGERTGVITLDDAESMLALEVTPVRVPGTDPEAGEALRLGGLYAKTGLIHWEEEPGQETIALEPQTCLVIDGQAAPAVTVVDEFPPWVTADAADMIGYLDGRASGTLQEALQLDRTAALGLLELTDHRQKEVVWLATRCLAYIGHFDHMLAMLNDPATRVDWPDCAEKLEAAISRNTVSAKAVRLAMEKDYGPKNGAAAYRMLWGYTNEDLQGGEDRTLVEHLEHETLALRRLSFWNLEQITGVRLLYRPEETLAKRKTPVQKWNQWLEEGQIRFKPPEEDAKPPPVQETPPREQAPPQS